MKTPTVVVLAALGGGVGAAAVWVGLNGMKQQAVAVVPKPIPDTLPAAPLQMPPPAAPPRRDHNYDTRDGIDYGYTAALSDTQIRAGQVGNKIVMLSYAGSRDGKHQVHARDGRTLTAMECAAPCEVVKILTSVDVDGLRETVNVERVRNVPGMLAGLALEDAIRGKLEPYVEYQGPRRYAVWVDERQGITRKRDLEAEARAAARAASSAPSSKATP